MNVNKVFEAAEERFGKAESLTPAELIDFVNDTLEKFGFPRKYDMKQLHELVKSLYMKKHSNIDQMTDEEINRFIDQQLLDKDGKLSDTVLKIFGYKL